ncbi:MAG TPA: type II toxin-antitoxin system CcdA family antitoxin [Chthoniobacterales bacterium]|nr:type II toxin-antitoxin system CcdA family antitoxin [Chthoniobacterales bacterium]
MAKTQRGGKRKGAGRKPQGKKAVLVTLTETNVKEAKKREGNFSGLLDRLLADWIER